MSRISEFESQTSAHSLIASSAPFAAGNGFVPSFVQPGLFIFYFNLGAFGVLFRPLAVAGWFLKPETPGGEGGKRPRLPEPPGWAERGYGGAGGGPGAAGDPRGRPVGGRCPYGTAAPGGRAVVGGGRAVGEGAPSPDPLGKGCGGVSPSPPLFLRSAGPGEGRAGRQRAGGPRRG